MSNENDPTGEVGPDGRYRVWFCAYPESPGGPCTPAIPHESNWGTCRWVSESAAYEPGDPAPSAPVAPEPDGRLTAGRFTVSTDPDGRPYLFGKNDPEPYDGFISGGVELFAWEPEAVDALRVALAAAPELETLRDRKTTRR